MSFEIKLPLFEGPFDLLLFFIERDELDIHDIPISRITHDFLEYTYQLEALNIELASEFMLVAATLMRIKAKMLLPRPQLNEEGQEIDPREELVRHLLEYKKYKSVVQELARMEEQQQLREKRGNVLAEYQQLASLQEADTELQQLDLYKLMQVFQRVMKRYEISSQQPVHQIVPYPYTISGQKSYMLQLLEASERVSFADIIAAKPEKIGVIFNFLAILELLQLNEINMHIGEGFNNFWIFKPAVPVSVSM
ncbi:segregation and condensation protein A [Cesiribacter andamanensis]|uniref:Segregation and condensation protein A n=1 Tax=Cesiribacter andamanensis AMV16 TaxID=1279009 RepID=M7N0U7_9BACT|nr:segregation/condensation protein A [Cesiribacter andamanensis]EMR02283.1 Segregation and condensation protein A [Cesiribacter andamanensis AMV16]